MPDGEELTRAGIHIGVSTVAAYASLRDVVVVVWTR
jgi:hypothetical protein